MESCKYCDYAAHQGPHDCPREKSTASARSGDSESRKKHASKERSHSQSSINATSRSASKSTSASSSRKSTSASLSRKSDSAKPSSAPSESSEMLLACHECGMVMNITDLWLHISTVHDGEPPSQALQNKVKKKIEESAQRVKVDKGLTKPKDRDAESKSIVKSSGADKREGGTSRESRKEKHKSSSGSGSKPAKSSKSSVVDKGEQGRLEKVDKTSKLVGRKALTKEDSDTIDREDLKLLRHAIMHRHQYFQEMGHNVLDVLSAQTDPRTRSQIMFITACPLPKCKFVYFTRLIVAAVDGSKKIFDHFVADHMDDQNAWPLYALEYYFGHRDQFDRHMQHLSEAFIKFCIKGFDNAKAPGFVRCIRRDENFEYESSSNDEDEADDENETSDDVHGFIDASTVSETIDNNANLQNDQTQDGVTAQLVDVPVPQMIEVVPCQGTIPQEQAKECNDTNGNAAGNVSQEQPVQVLTQMAPLGGVVVDAGSMVCAGSGVPLGPSVTNPQVANVPHPAQAQPLLLPQQQLPAHPAAYPGQFNPFFPPSPFNPPNFNPFFMQQQPPYWGSHPYAGYGQNAIPSFAQYGYPGQGQPPQILHCPVPVLQPGQLTYSILPKERPLVLNKQIGVFTTGLDGKVHIYPLPGGAILSEEDSKIYDMAGEVVNINNVSGETQN